MGIARHLLILALTVAVCYCQEDLNAPNDCREVDDADYNTLPFGQVNRQGNLDRFCQRSAADIRREHFWCRGYFDENGTVIPNTAFADFPEDPDEFWTIFLQFPALSFMDSVRKAQIFRIIHSLADNGDGCETLNPYREFCISNVETYRVSYYMESVLVTIYNLGMGLSGSQFDECFQASLRAGSNDNITQFLQKTAFRLTLTDVSLMEMFNKSISPASTLGDEDRDPTLRPIFLRSFPRNVTKDYAVSRVTDDDFGENPDPINYGLEAGDVVFLIFGCILLLVVMILVILGFFIHPFFLS